MLDPGLGIRDTGHDEDIIRTLQASTTLWGKISLHEYQSKHVASHRIGSLPEYFHQFLSRYRRFAKR